MTVSGTGGGSLMVNAFGLIQTGPAAKFFFIKDNSGDIRLEDGFTNIIGTGQSGLALFKDLARYTSQQPDVQYEAVNVQIVKAT